MNKKETPETIFNLDPRLLACVKFIRPYSCMVDVGTDHAYLPIWLVKKNIINKALAGDISLGPLERAKKNICKYKVEDSVKCVLSDGLSKISPNEADDIVISGLGADLIIKIIKETPWLRDINKHLILQPMSRENYLREFLDKNKFSILKETTAVSNGKVYVIMLCVYNPHHRPSQDPLYIYIGKTQETNSSSNLMYLEKVLRRLINKRKSSDNKSKMNFLIEKLKEVITNVKNFSTI